ncbi:MAG: glycoside hydrolase family 3 C-terminal domain-containing protein, partial [Bifidobacteriaceae bacterium]|nr:glycoside hydrolase family 3 C-terminal domain-containing protein [Bifidobacteriaceae bacterium]
MTSALRMKPSSPPSPPRGRSRRWRSRAIASCATAGLALGALVVPLTAAPVGAAPAPTPIYKDDSGAYSFEERAVDLVGRMTLDEKLTQFSASTSPAARAIPRLDVRAYRYWNEALHGVARNGEATSFPTGLGIGATWNRELVAEGLAAAGDEARAYWNTGSLNYGLTYWSPTINMGRDPRWGRAEESFGEDPYLMGEIAGAFVDGLQSDDPTYLKSVATAKHYAANNNENNRHADSSDMSQKDLREFYLPAFQNVTENHDLGSLMTAYNSVNGTPMPANEFLVEDVLRRTWGFDGFITSDCGAIDNVGADHQWTPSFQDHLVTRPEATAYSIKAGTDIDCSGGQYTANLAPALNEGLLTEDDVDIALVRMFTIRMKTGEFESSPPWPASTYSVANEISAPDHLETAEVMSEEAIVLLKNEAAAGESAPILPLPKGAGEIDNIVVAGTLADRMVLGDYSASSTVDGNSNCEGTTTPCNHPLNGIREAVEAMGGAGASVTFVANNDSNDLTDAEKATVAAADAVIVVVGTYNSDSSEGGDRGNLNIPRQATLANAVAAENPRTVVYISSVAMVDIEAFRNNVPAILWSTYNGQRQGTAIGRVLWSIDGVNPSARLPFTWYTSASELPGIKDYVLAPHDGARGRTYQYFTGAITYPFGHGLSYADFTYANLRLDRATATGDDTVTATVNVANTSGVAGQTVVQLYAKSPLADGQTRPKAKLVAFDKISLKAHQTKAVRFEVPVSDLWYWDEAASAERIDLGTWTLQSGASVADDATVATFEVTAPRTRTLQQVRTIPSGAVLDLDNPDASIDAGASAAANDQSFYNLSDPAVRVVYTSSNPAVASVSRAGEVRGVSDGVATITATVTAEGTTASDSFAVSVTHTAPRLATLSVGGTALADFDPDTTSYVVELSSPTATPAALAGTAGEGLTVEVADATAAGETGTVTVRDAAGGYTVYSVRFAYHAPFTSVDFRPMTSLADLEAADWSVIDESPAAWRLTTDGLAIDTERGDLYQSDQPPAKNTFVHDAEGSWVATVKVDPGGQLNTNYQQGYIAVRQDADNYVKVGYQHNGNPNVVFLTETGASAVQVSSGQNWSGVNPSPPLWLRLVKDGTTYTGFYSVNGVNFTRVGTPTSMSLNEPKFAIGSFYGTSAAVIPVRTFTFEGVNVEPLATRTPLASYNFAGKTATDLTSAGWSVIRENTATLSYDPTGLTIQTEAGDLYQTNSPVGGGPNSAANLVGHDAPGDWAATIDIDVPDVPTANYRKNAILAYEDDDNFVFLAFQHDGGRSVELSVEANGVRQSDQRTVVAIPDPAPTAIQLRLEKIGDSYRGFYTTDTGVDPAWTEVSTAPVTLASTFTKLVFGNYGSVQNPGTATFKSLTVGEPTQPTQPPATPFASLDLRGKTRADIVDTAGWEIVRENTATTHYGPTGLVIDTEAGGLWGSTGGA